MIKNKFYVGSSHLADDTSLHLKKTIDIAIAEAKQQCEDTGEPQIVVKIVAIIESTKQPVKVTKI